MQSEKIPPHHCRIDASPLIRCIVNHADVTDGLRAQLGITVPDRSPTRRQVGPEVPGLFLELKPGQVVLHFGTTPQNEQTNGKPAWATGYNLYRKKPSKTDYTLIAFDTASPYVDTSPEPPPTSPTGLPIAAFAPPTRAHTPPNRPSPQAGRIGCRVCPSLRVDARCRV